MQQGETLGRPPVMRFKPVEVDHEAVLAETDWRGEHFLRVETSKHGGGNYAFIRKDSNESPKPKPKKATKSTPGPAPSSKVAARRQRVWNLYQKGLSQKDIAKIVRASLSTVNADIFKMRQVK